MNEKRKIWLAVGAAVLTTSTTSAVAQPQTFDHAMTATTMNFVAPLAGQGGGEGEGEGSGQLDLRTNDAAYLAQLGLIRGHLYVGKQLYDEGHLAMAKTHMKHPKDELYSALVPAFTARKVAGFADELQQLADAVNNDEGAAAVNAAYDKLLTAISASENISEHSVKAVLLSLSSMLLTAAEEYDLGIQQGKVVNVHEFQDAYGFTTIAKARFANLTAAQIEANQAAIDEVKEVLEGLPGLWPTITPTGAIEGDASALFGAAARIELATLN